MKTDLHLAGLPVIHGGAQLVIGHKAVVFHTEGVEHIPVRGPQQGQIHEQRHQRAAEKAGYEIPGAESHHNGNYNGADHSAANHGHGGVPLGADGDQILLRCLHPLDHRVGSEEIEQELAYKQIEPEPSNH